MTKKLSFILTGVFMVCQIAVAQATNFTVSASVPLSTGITMTVNKVTVGTTGGVTFVAQPAGTTNLPFGTLTLNTTTNTYADGAPGATFYWAIDLTPSNGSGVAQPTVGYTETTSLPAGQTQGLGSRAGIQFAKVTNSTIETAISGEHYTLAALGSGVTVPYTDAAGGFMRMDIGLCTGNTNTANGAVDPTGCLPFSPADLPATYSGTLSVTAAVN